MNQMRQKRDVRDSEIDWGKEERKREREREERSKMNRRK